MSTSGSYSLTCNWVHLEREVLRLCKILPATLQEPGFHWKAKLQQLLPYGSSALQVLCGITWSHVTRSGASPPCCQSHSPPASSFISGSHKPPAPWRSPRNECQAPNSHTLCIGDRRAPRELSAWSAEAAGRYFK